jgi:hypothetical protein
MIYSIAQRTSNVTSGAASHTILTAASSRIALLEAGVFMGAATASQYGLGRPAADGVTAGTKSLFQAEDVAAPASVTNGVLTWTTSPTSPAVLFRRWSSPATIGTGVIWTFPRGLVVAASTNLALQNLATNGVVDSYFVIDEK